MKFKGDIIITDPCYIDDKTNTLWDNRDIDIFTGDGISKLGFTNYIWDTTIYGDWSCTTYETVIGKDPTEIEELTESDVIKPLGEFCADAGLVGVFLLDEVLKFNPKFDYHINRPWATTLIKDFDGEVYYTTHKDEVRIVGKGNINFITTQTGA